jgi:hypothetical protein
MGKVKSKLSSGYKKRFLNLPMMSQFLLGGSLDIGSKEKRIGAFLQTALQLSISARPQKISMAWCLRDPNTYHLGQEVQCL